MIDTPITGEPDTSVIIWYVDKQFLHRSGWEGLEIHNDSNNTNEVKIKNIQSFIDIKYTQLAKPEEVPDDEIKEENFPELDGDISNFFNN